MKNVGVVALVVACLAGGTAYAQTKPVFAVKTIGEGLYELSTDGGGYPVKVIASVGDDGLLIVDSGGRRGGQALAEELLKFGKGLPKIVINTHSHIEHIGGNAEVGRGAVIVAHQNVRDRYLHGLYAFGDFPPEALPNLTFTDSLVLHFNGQNVRLTAFGGAHDDSDIVVWFEKSKIAVVGALCMGRHFPSIDEDAGDILRYPDVTARVLASLPDDARLVPAHADDCTMAEARQFLDMLVKTSAIVRAEMDKGRGLERMQADDVLAAYASFESSYVKRGDWIEYWYDAFRTPRSSKPKPYAPVFEALDAHGPNAAMEEYGRLKRSHADEYWFEDMALMYMGRRLARLHRWTDAQPFLERCIVEFPGTEGAAVSHHVLSTVFEELGQVVAAIEHEKIYLGNHPEDGSAQKHLVELEARLKTER